MLANKTNNGATVNTNTIKGGIDMYDKNQIIAEDNGEMAQAQEVLNAIAANTDSIVGKALKKHGYVKEEITMTAKTKKDYTLNGTINATTWQEFRTAMKDAGISTGTKTYEQLATEYEYRNRKFCVMWEERHDELEDKAYEGISQMFKTEQEALDKVNKLNALNKDGEFRYINAYEIKDGKYVEIENQTATTAEAEVVAVGDDSTDKYYPELQEEVITPKVIINQKQGDKLVRKIVAASEVTVLGSNAVYHTVKLGRLFGIIKGVYGGTELVPREVIEEVINELVRLKYLGFKRYNSGAIVFYITNKAVKYTVLKNTFYNWVPVNVGVNRLVRDMHWSKEKAEAYINTLIQSGDLIADEDGRLIDTKVYNKKYAVA